MFSIYIHCPYCTVRCGYCNFHAHAVGEKLPPSEAYTTAVIRQLRWCVKHYDLSGREVGSVFFGGGTPSILTPSFFHDVLAAIQETLTLAPHAEVTSEVNPVSGKRAWLEAVRNAGVNRLSTGIQSFVPRHLTLLDRTHTADDIHRILTDMRAAGFENISCDLIFGIPGQTHEEVESDVSTALSFAVPHFSAYQLTFEPGTPLYKRYLTVRHCEEHGDEAISRNPPPKLDDEEILAQMSTIEHIAIRNGFKRYEISNYSRPGFESQHNLNYWRYGEYLGLGSGAVSFLRNAPQSPLTRPLLCKEGQGEVDRDLPHLTSPYKGEEIYTTRWHTTRNIERYLAGDFSEGGVDVISERAAMGEFCFLGLRAMEGISISRFQKHFGKSFDDVFPGVCDALMEKGLLCRDGDRLRLTPRGIELSNEVFRQFV